MSREKCAFNDQIRMVGEELIRRADQFDFGSLDLVQKINISVEIDGDSDKICFPDVKFNFVCLNKTVCDRYLEDLENG